MNVMIIIIVVKILQPFGLKTSLATILPIDGHIV